MGLDMYLSVNEYGYGDWEFKDQKLLGYKINKVVAEAVYWRKANQIHDWFVQNVQDGNDDCRSYEVSMEQLTELRDLCSTALKTKDESLLPPSTEFFFGDTSIDEGHWQQIEYTRDEISKLLETLSKIEGDGRIVYVTYQSSW